MNVAIGNRAIGLDNEPFVIAELSGNHNQSLERALDIADAAAAAGAHALKLQTYRADTMTVDVSGGDFEITEEDSLWHGKNLYQLYQEAFTPWEWHEKIAERCEEQGMLCFSTPFDDSAVDFLEELGMPAYKIASFELRDLPLVKKAASTGKPLILSTGMASISEIDEAVRAASDSGCQQLILLKCTSSYPALPINSNIRTIPHLRQLFNVEVGLSDHTLGIGVAVASVALGATVIEKHLTLSRKDGGVDAQFSIEPHELKALVEESKRAWQGLGEVQYGSSAAEQVSRGHQRSLYIVQDMKAGEALTRDNLGRIRPAGGLSPKYYEIFIGRRVNRDVASGTPVTWDLV